MEEILEQKTKESTISIEKKEKRKNKKKFTIFGFTFIQICAYFIIYSVIGYIIETIVGF